MSQLLHTCVCLCVCVHKAQRKKMKGRERKRGGRRKKGQNKVYSQTAAMLLWLTKSDISRKIHLFNIVVYIQYTHNTNIEWHICSINPVIRIIAKECSAVAIHSLMILHYPSNNYNSIGKIKRDAFFPFFFSIRFTLPSYNFLFFFFGFIRSQRFCLWDT